MDGCTRGEEVGYRKNIKAKASAELDNLAMVLANLGVKVRRPMALDFTKEYKTSWWKSRGLYAAMPRDVLLVIGDIIIEAPIAWRSRYFEIFAYRELLEDYSRNGARWLVAPKPSMSDGFYNADYDPERAEIN